MIFIWVNYLDNPLTVHVTLLWYHACLLRHLMKASSSFAAPGSLTLPPNPFSTFFSLSRIKLSCSYLWGHNCSCCITSVFVFFWRDWFLFFFLSFVSFSVCFGGFLCVPLYVCKHVKREDISLLEKFLCLPSLLFLFGIFLLNLAKRKIPLSNNHLCCTSY